jgi:NAD(P)-dependent dehydrogenase (short-subunit alcohol dehydrogenase family)
MNANKAACFEMKENPKVAITGAGSGLGAAMARRFAAAGYDVAVTDINAQRASDVFDELSRSGFNGFCEVLDTTSEADWTRFHQRVMQQWGGLDVLVNNAGVAAAGCCEETSMQDWQWVMDVDLMGVVRGCHEFLPLFRQQDKNARSAYIINVASFAGMSSMPGLCAYGTAKAAVIALSEHLRTELADTGIGVSVICPAFVKTNLMDDFRSPDPSQRDKVARWMENSGVSAEDVANAVIEAIGKRRFMVLTHGQTRWAYYLKRFWPERYFRQMSKMGTQLRKKAA